MQKDSKRIESVECYLVWIDLSTYLATKFGFRGGLTTSSHKNNIQLQKGLKFKLNELLKLDEQI